VTTDVVDVRDWEAMQRFAAGVKEAHGGADVVINNAGLGDLVGRTTDEYVDIAVRLAADPARIGELRRTLRDRLSASPLRDARGFSADWHAMVERAMVRK
jgi:predicted O-linked N-acetylglucosamine transferase (SPINDLY family)